MCNPVGTLQSQSLTPHAYLVDILVGGLEDEQMHRRATAIRDFYRQHTYAVVSGAEHELWHPNYLAAIKTALARLRP